MTSDQNLGERIGSLIKKSNTVAVIPSRLAGDDPFYAAVAMYYMLKEQGKSVQILYKGKLPDGSGAVIAEDQITTEIKDRSLYVSIDYSGTQAAKVHYSTENDVLHLRIAPIPSNYDKDQRIAAKVTGQEFDLVITVGALNIGDLGNVYEHLDMASKMAKILNIDNTNKNERFGYINIIDASVSSLSMLLFQKSITWGLTPNDKAAKALLKGIETKEPKFRN